MSMELYLQRQKNVQKVEMIILIFIMKLKHFGLLFKKLLWIQDRKWIRNQ